MKRFISSRKLIASVIAVALATAFSLLMVNVKVDAAGDTITGQVYGGGDNLLGAYVYATNVGGTTPIYGPFVTNANGYSLNIATPGTYDIHFIPPSNSGYAPYVDSSVSVTSDQTINYTFTDITHTLSGTLTDSSGDILSGVTIEAIGGSVHYNASTTTDSNGNYSFTLPAGEYSLSLSGSMPGVSSFSMAQSTADSINLLNFNQTLNLTIPVATVSVTALDDGGQSIANIVTAYAKSGVTSLYPGDPGTSISNIYSDGFDAGSGTITTIVGATYAGSGLGSSSNTSSICEGAARPTYDCLALPATITGNTSLDVPYASPATRTFSGTLTDGNGNPVSGADVTLVSGNDVSAYAQTNANGNFTINAMPKKYYLEVQTGGFDGMDYLTLTQSSSNPTMDLTNDNLTQNLQIQTVTLTVYGDDSSGDPDNSTDVNAQTSSGTTTLYSGDPGESISVESDGFGTFNGNPGTIGTVNGAEYSAYGLNSSQWLGSICDSGSSSGYFNCLTTAYTVDGSATIRTPF